MPLSAPTPALLTSGRFYGTLAAARSLGRAGIPVVLAESGIAPAGFSRYVVRSERSPNVRDSDDFMEWLLKYGADHGPHVLSATSDDTVWLYALHHAELTRHFRLFQPRLAVIEGLLNKYTLSQHCDAVGLRTPRTWWPASEEEVAAVAREARFPVLIKPITQALSNRGKGSIVENRSELVARYASYRRLESASYGRGLLNRMPRAEFPALQEYHARAASGIYGISGFIDESGEVFLARASLKRLQYPRRLGIGLCFEEAAIHGEVVEHLRRLCRHVNYYGVFEVEFVPGEDGMLLLDFNPRFYNQLGFDIDRGLPLALLAYHAALGQRDEVSRLGHGALPSSNGAPRVYADRFKLELTLLLWRFSGASFWDEARYWRAWCRTHRENRTDAVLDRDDWLPGAVDVAQTLWSCARHPRSFIRRTLHDR
jgi:D-aspartate ligase